MCCVCRYCFESDVPINMEGQEALLDWALLRMGVTGVGRGTNRFRCCLRSACCEQE